MSGPHFRAEVGPLYTPISMQGLRMKIWTELVW